MKFVTIGGIAAAAHGSAQITNDLDICYERSDANVGRLAELLASWKAYPRNVERNLPFFMDSRTFRTTPRMTLETVEGAIDVLDRVAGVGDFAGVLARSQVIEAFGVKFRILDLPGLIASKRGAGRPKDLAQLPELEAVLALLHEAEDDGSPRTADGSR